MVLAALVAQTADVLTYSPHAELNPVAGALGPWLLIAKFALIAYLAWLGLRFSDHPIVKAALSFAFVAGTFGAWSNL